VSKRDNRRYQRIPCLGAARIFWEDERGPVRYAQAKCLDISLKGLCLEVAEPIPVRSILSVAPGTHPSQRFRHREVHRMAPMQTHPRLEPESSP
jgi:hypothetical protein